MALIEKLNAIGNAIRSKTGGTALLTLDEMPALIGVIGGTACVPRMLPRELSESIDDVMEFNGIDKYAFDIDFSLWEPGDGRSNYCRMEILIDGEIRYCYTTNPADGYDVVGDWTKTPNAWVADNYRFVVFHETPNAALDKFYNQFDEGLNPALSLDVGETNSPDSWPIETPPIDMDNYSGRRSGIRHTAIRNDGVVEVIADTITFLPNYKGLTDGVAIFYVEADYTFTNNDTGEEYVYTQPYFLTITVGEGDTGGTKLPEDAYTFSQNCNYAFANGNWDWFIENYGADVLTQFISNASYMFENSQVEEIPFELNFLSTATVNIDGMFSGCSNLKSIPKINGCKPSAIYFLFYDCRNLRELPENFASWFDWSYLATDACIDASGMFCECRSLRAIPTNIFENVCPDAECWYAYTNLAFAGCFVLDELTGLPIVYNAEWMENAFNMFCNSCYRLKNLTFAMDNNQPYVKNWANQVIELHYNVGWGTTVSAFTGYNSGITADKLVKDAATYQALKNDADWFTTSVEYSRYNHDSAVATINSLPDTSAYLAANGGTNTITFEGEAGSATDGGAINTLTQEELAVAAAKGWTVAFM